MFLGSGYFKREEMSSVEGSPRSPVKGRQMEKKVDWLDRAII